MSIGPQRPESLLGQTIAGYRLVSFIGTGAAGLVFRARRVGAAPAIIERTGFAPPDYPDEAAIKLLAPPVGASQDELAGFQARFLREARTLKKLDHPHILRLIDFGEDTASGYSYMLLPYMAGGSLASLSARGPLPFDLVDGILVRIADALDYAHAQGVVHRDVKPGNILLDASGAPYLSDFSIVRLLSEGATLRTTTGRVMGTPSYMAPEQFDDASKVGPAADLYGLGMVVYELVTGRVAFSATSWAQVMKAQLQDPPPLPRALRPDLPEPAEAAILRALAKDPEQRFTSAAAFARAFDLGLAGQWDAGLTRYAPPIPGVGIGTTSGAPTAPFGQRASNPPPSPRSLPWGLVGIAAALLLIVACVGGLFASGQASPLLAFFRPHVTAVTSAPGATASGVASATATAGTHATAPPGQPTRPPAGNGGATPAPTTSSAPTATLAPSATLAATATFAPTATPLPTATPTPPVYTGDIALYAALSSPNGAVSQIVADGSLSQQWVCCHPVEVDLSWAGPQTIHRIVVWDRFQNSPDNNQINTITIVFSNGQSISSIDMSSGGPRCADVNFGAMSVTSVKIKGVDSSGTNGFREIEVWATTGLQSSGNTCSNVKNY